MKFLKQAFSFIKKTLGLGFGYVRNHEFISVETVNHFKSIVRSKAVKAGVKITPTKFDDKLQVFLDTIAIPILEEVALLHGIIRDNEKNSEAIDLIIDRIRILSPEKEGQVYADFGARLNYRLADGHVSLKESWDQVQDTFNTFFKKK